MLATRMARRTATKRPAATKTQFNVRLEDDLIEKLDEWVDELNENRTVPIDRSKLIRGVLRWAAETHPDFERVG